jgi:hypothetical protein
MLIIYGTRKKLKLDRNLGRGVCPNCHHDVERSLAREKFAVTLFYIPVLGWTSKRLIVCPCCGDSEVLTGGQYKELKNA